MNSDQVGSIVLIVLLIAIGIIGRFTNVPYAEEEQKDKPKEK